MRNKATRQPQGTHEALETPTWLLPFVVIVVVVDVLKMAMAFLAKLASPRN